MHVMAILCSGGVKGGVGKTTLATNLTILRAGQGRDVLLVDADPQQSATDFTALRIERQGDPGYTCGQLHGNALRAQVQRMRTKYDDIIIDAGGRDTVSQRAAIALADVLLVPFQPRSFDVWTMEQMIAMVEEMRPANPGLRVMCLLNRADSRGGDNDEAAQMLAEKLTEAGPGYTMLNERIGNRKAFSNAAAAGSAAHELKPPDEKASAEIEAICSRVFQVQGAGKRARAAAG
jgi:chromosome partitioning protein